MPPDESSIVKSPSGPVSPGAAVTTPFTRTRAPGVWGRAAPIEIVAGSDALGDGEARRVGDGDAVGAVVAAKLEGGEGVGSAVGWDDVRSGAVGLAVAVGWGRVGSGPVGSGVGSPLELPAAVVTDAAVLMVGVVVAPLLGRGA